jgi:hypothetical protein
MTLFEKRRLPKGYSYVTKRELADNGLVVAHNKHNDTFSIKQSERSDPNSESFDPLSVIKEKT